MKMRFSPAVRLLCLVAVCLAAISSAQASNLVSDGDFTSYPGPWFTTQTNDNFPWRWGSGYASTGCEGPTCITGTTGQLADLDQDLATVAGDFYNVSFSYSPEGGTPTALKVLFGGTVVADLVDVPDSLVTYNYTGILASSSSTELTFLGRQDPAYDYLTDVVVSGTSHIPEPSSLYLLGTGLAGLAVLVRRKLKA